jgi:hypothetical protein
MQIARRIWVYMAYSTMLAFYGNGFHGING